MDVKQINQQTSAFLKINLAAIRHNWLSLHRQFVGTTECAAVLKADAYGLGMEEVACALRDHVKTFFVAHPEEGISLRAFLPSQKIFILHGFLPDQIDDMVRHKLVPVLNSYAQVKQWQDFCKSHGCCHPVALQFDSGMSRFGLSEEDLDKEALSSCQPVLVMSHLACADHPNDPANEWQRQNFIRMAQRFPGVPRSLAASSGIFLGAKYHFDLVRPGAALYGIAPNEETPHSLKSVVELDARILQIRHLSKGASVGYGLTWEAKHATRIATVGIGYADGFLRSAGNKAALWWHDKRLPVVGRVSMDSLSVDISTIPEYALKDDMSLSVIGPHQDVDSLARSAGTIGYEILTSLGRRFSRIYCDNE
ncbi:alanine racemase [Saccharibacter sp. EH611]|nr:MULTISPECIES: alanine racemase [unclassified Saccharibacter]MXV35297.1 alanine racemase [Saccharibacter sp. EH611]MXV57855.1 alanine racemase [Saccharibacter sp. EH70]MXV65231.1 alanine racemase [Saccharibacter sp. EH60]